VSSDKVGLERKFMIVVAVIWIMLLAVLPLVNTASVQVFGIPLLWFWVLMWVIIVPIVLSIAYIMLER
jgi:uncharacterized membrane protein YagU involved in acid resistance